MNEKNCCIMCDCSIKRAYVINIIIGLAMISVMKYKIEEIWLDNKYAFTIKDRLKEKLPNIKIKIIEYDVENILKSCRYVIAYVKNKNSVILDAENMINVYDMTN